MGWPMLIVGTIGIITGGVLLFSKLFLVGFLFLFFAIFLLAGLKRVHEQDRWVIELFGKFSMILWPGLGWILPGFMRTRAIVPVWEQTVSLFEEPVKIDFKNGSAAPRGAKAFLQIKDTKQDIHRAVYAVANWRKAVAGLLQNALRSYLNGLDIEEGLEQGKAGYDFLEQIEPNKKDGIIASLDRWGIRIHRVTIEDFDLDATIIKAREGVLEAERRKAAADQIAIQKAMESGGIHGEIRRILVEKYGYTSGEANQIAFEYVKYFKGAETGRLIDFRGGEGDIYAVIAKAVVAINMAIRGTSEEKEKKRDKEESAEKEDE